MPDKVTPLVVLGLDVGDPDSITRWTQKGYLPTIASIVERGCWARTAGPDLIMEDGVWTTLFSGVSLGQHGHYYYRQLTPGTYDLQTATRADFEVLPFWAHLRGRGKKVAIIDAPHFTPLQQLPGVQLSDWAVHNALRPPSAEPGELVNQVKRVFGPPMKIDEKTESSFEEDRQIYSRLMERVQKKGALCLDLLSRDHFDLVVVVFTECHTGTHQFWKYRPDAALTVQQREEGALTYATRNIYQEIDRQMGSLVRQLPAEANFFIVSSTGMEDHYPIEGLMQTFCRQLGYQAPPEAGPPSLSPLGVARRILPEPWRIAISRHFPRATRERLLADQFRSGTNWGKTTAFAIPSSYKGLVWLNLRGREPQGIVEPGREYEELLDRLEADLKRLIDPRTGQPAVKQVVRTGQAFGSSPPHLLPELVVIWKPASYFMEKVVHPRAELTQTKPEFFRDNDHTQNGFVAAAGPGIRRSGKIRDVSLLDLAPTFSSLLGEPVPEEATGHAIEEMVGAQSGPE